jgi:hypothetical protein
MINNEENFNRYPPAAYDGQFHWDVFHLSGCFADTKIKPMDFDGVVERKLNYLIFESKDNGKEVPQAQQWTLDRLSEAKSFSVIEVWPKRPPFEVAHIIYNGNRNNLRVIKGHAAIIKAVASWFAFADGRKEVLTKDYDSVLEAIWADLPKELIL